MGDIGNEPVRDPMADAPRRKFTVSDYHRMADAGIFAPDDRVELIEGEVFEMGKIGPQHAGVVNFLTARLVLAAGGRFVLTPQNPVEISTYSEPQPDLSLSLPRADFYRKAHPLAGEVMLVIEVSDSRLRWDRDVKIPMYGRRGVREAWLVEIPRRVVTLYRDPGSKGYGSSTEVAQGAVSPLCLPELQLDIGEIFGPA